MFDQEDAEQILASAVHFLLAGNDSEAAAALLPCTLEIEIGKEYNGTYVINIYIRAPRSSYNVLQSHDTNYWYSVDSAITAVLPIHYELNRIILRAAQVSVEADWRKEVLAQMQGTTVHNQAVDAPAPRIWKNLRFRSESEVRIAAALDAVGALFLPNCRARLGAHENRVNREADFLVCHNGKWGLLEVDGEPFHPPQRATQDHARDLLFQNHGSLITHHADATECFENAPMVVARFLRLLERL